MRKRKVKQRARARHRKLAGNKNNTSRKTGRRSSAIPLKDSRSNVSQRDSLTKGRRYSIGKKKSA